jgi:hypothetical protein
MKHLVGIIILFFAFNASSQTIITEAPSVSASAISVPKNSFQIESSFGISSSYTNGYSYTNLTIPSNLFRLGITNRLELRVTNGLNLRINNGPNSLRFSPFQIGGKFQFIKYSERRSSLALIVNANIPSPNSSFRQYNSNLAFSQRIKSRHTIGVNLGYGISFSKIAIAPTNYHRANYSAIYTYKLNSKLSVFGELFGTYGKYNSNPFNDNNFSTDFGFMYLVRDNIQIDYSYGRGLIDNFDFHSLGFNILLNSKKK